MKITNYYNLPKTIDEIWIICYNEPIIMKGMNVMSEFIKSKRKITGAICILAAAAMTLSAFTGCSSKKGESSSDAPGASISQEELAKALAYKVDEMRIDNRIGSEITYKNGLLYTSVYVSEKKGENYYSKNYLIAFDKSGEIKLSIPVYVQEKDNEYGSLQGTIQVDDNGNITIMYGEGSWDEATGESTSSQSLITYDSTGKEIGRINLDNVVTQEDMNEGRYFNNYLLDKQGNIYINLGSCIRVCDNTGNVIFTTESVNNDNTWMDRMLLTNEGVPVVNIHEYGENKSTSKLMEIDLVNKKFGKEYEISSNLNNLYSGTGDYICFSSGDTGIIGVRADTLEAEPVMNMLSLGVDTSNMNSFTICEDGTFLVSSYDWNGAEPAVVLNFITPDESVQAVEKQVVTLGCFSLDWNLRSVVADFNKTNDKYIINVQSYSETNDTSDYSAALTKFNNELLAGNIPDLLIVNNSMPYDSYVSKGLFADLYELLDADPAYAREDFMPNILTAGEKDGKLYSMATAFNVQTFAAKKSLVGDNATLSVDKANEILASMHEGATMFSYLMTASDFVNMAVQYSDYVDYVNGSCNFDTPEFKAVLETAKGYPAEIDYDTLYNENPNYWMETETACRDNKALLYSTYLYDFESYYRTEKAYFGEEIAMVGFPGCSEDSSSLIYLQSQLAISNKSKCKEGAWEFIKTVLDNGLTESVQTPYVSEEENGKYEVGMSITVGEAQKKEGIVRYANNNGALPVLTDQLKKLAEQSTKPYSYYDENGNIVEEEQTYWIGDQEVKIGSLTQADADKVLEYFKTATRVYKYDENLYNIINEETAAFFNGTKTADETASIIQSRVSIYMSEQY